VLSLSQTQTVVHRRQRQAVTEELVRMENVTQEISFRIAAFRNIFLKQPLWFLAAHAVRSAIVIILPSATLSVCLSVCL